MSDVLKPQSDEAWMAAAIRMAERGWGTTAPNPAVGAIIVDEAKGEVLGRGWTQPGGRPHAEVEAIARASGMTRGTRGATIFVTLEPCAHFGKTPPCVDAILEAGLRRVVCGVEDPDPRVGGKGLNRLREAGLAVRRGVLRTEANWVTLGHILRVTERRPFIQLKIAVGPGGDVPRGGAGQPAWVTSERARAHGHLLRAEADAILVGAGTVRDDEPALTCRLPGLAGRSPARVVLSRSLVPGQGLTLLETAAETPVWWFCSADASKVDRERIRRTGGEVHPVREVGGRLWLPSVLETLVEKGVTRLLVEGGPGVWAAFDRAGLVDEVVLFHARAGNGAPVPDERARTVLRRYAPHATLPALTRRSLGSDDIFSFRRRVLSK
jgi:diaminohydroxyphosphoribosylaminopyrimidine deaminase / 5-amino-6-(5-phosphoribosylamino)uracil reductase